MRTIGFIVPAALAVWFIAANTDSATIRLWVADVMLPLWTVLAATLLAGTVLGVLIAHRRARR
ncbi:LapA family protein [Streptomyces sp. NPDC048604]|uniref:LapA family protein n=1 Tax=Streptomyces sp. NPDC048604 TaxID=3365578 RepID=UPI00371B343B